MSQTANLHIASNVPLAAITAQPDERDRAD